MTGSVCFGISCSLLKYIIMGRGGKGVNIIRDYLMYFNIIMVERLIFEYLINRISEGMVDKGGRSVRWKGVGCGEEGVKKGVGEGFY